MAETNGQKVPKVDPEVARLMMRLTEVASELAVASIPRVAELTNALEIFAARAKNGDGQAKENLRRFYKALDDSRDALRSIEVVRKA